VLSSTFLLTLRDFTIFMLLCTLISAVGIYFYVPQGSNGATPLIATSGENHPQVASYLISKGARVNYQTKVIHYSIVLLISLLTKVFPTEWLHVSPCSFSQWSLSCGPAID
jgi:hypothetical protein